MNLHCEIGIEVSKTDNGYVLEWKDETLDDTRGFVGDRRRRTRGMEVFRKKDELLARIAQLI